jgi:hypothetical protein
MSADNGARRSSMNPCFEVVVWYKLDPMKDDLCNRIIARIGREPDEGFEAETYGDLHWKFDTEAAAISAAESLFEFAAFSSVVRLVVNGYRDEDFERKVYKDTRGKTIQD